MSIRMHKLLWYLLLSALIGGCQLSHRNIMEGSMVTVIREGSFTLGMSPDRALPLFTAPGETLWVPHWEPVILYGDGTETGTVFITHNHEATTYWLVNHYDLNSKQASYHRVTPGWDTGTVSIRVTPEGTSVSRIHVRYQLTSLSQQGIDRLNSTFDEIQYQAMLKKWQRLIEENKNLFSTTRQGKL